MSLAGIHADTLSFRKRGQAALWLFRKISRQYHIIYHLSGCSAPFCLLARLCGKRMICHWTGSDTLRFQGKRSLFRRMGIWVQRNLVDLQMADSEIIQKELKEVGIEAHLLRLLPKTILGKITDLPEQPVVLSYWNDKRFDFYNGPLVFKLAEDYPKVKFLIALATGKDLTQVPKNVHFLGQVSNMSDIYHKCTCLVRMPRHDGLSAMVLEAMAHGRYVIYNQKCLYTNFAEDYNSARQALEKILRKTQPNFEGAEYVGQNFNTEREALELRRLLEFAFGEITTDNPQ